MLEHLGGVSGVYCDDGRPPSQFPVPICKAKAPITTRT